MQSVVTFLTSGHHHALCLIFASASAIQALVAIWAATSRIHWFWRAAAVWTAITALLPIRAYQPALVFTITSLLTVVVITMAARRGRSIARSESPMRFRFGIRDLLLVMTIAGLALVSLTHLVPRLGRINPVALSLAVAAQTLIPLLALAAVTSHRWRLATTALIGTIVVWTTACYFCYRWVGADWNLISVLFESRWPLRVLGVGLGVSEFAIILLVAMACVHAPRAQATASHVGAGRMLLRLVAAAWILALGWIYWQMLWLLPLPPPFSDQTTHHARLLQISSQMRSLQGATLAKSIAQKSELVEETIALVGNANYVPYDPSHDAAFDAWNNNFIAPAQLVRDLARVLDAECSAALASGEHGRACELALANVRLGLMLKRGGTLVEFLIGTAVQGVAAKRLIAARAELAPDQAQQVIAGWERALAEQEDIAPIEYRDRAMAERAYGWAARLSNILDFAGLRSGTYLAATINNPDRRCITTARLLQADLAIRLYQQVHGRPPDTLRDLVPAYLTNVTLDAYNGQPLTYRPSGDSFLLYSVGHDLIDNGGNCTSMATYDSRDGLNRPVKGYDFDLDTNTRP